MSTLTVTAKEPSRALRYWAVGLSALAAIAMAFMVSGIRPEGALLDLTEASSSLVAPIALIVNIVSVLRHHRQAIDIASLVVSVLIVAAMAVDAIIYTMGG
jgi:hypothetical protein